MKRVLFLCFVILVPWAAWVAFKAALAAVFA